MFLLDQLRSACFDNLDKAGNVLDYLIVIDRSRFLLHICILVTVMFHLLRDEI